MMKSRNEYIDFLKGIAIMMVVAIHTFPQVTGYNSLREDLMLVLRQIMNCAVPLFLALSGYFMAKKSFDNRNEIWGFWKKQIPRVFIPMVVWSLGWFILSLINSDCFSDVLIGILRLFTGGFSVYYFVALIIQCYLILPILARCKWGGVVACAIVSFAAIIATNYYLTIKGCQLPVLLYAGPVYLWIVFFMLGIFMSKYPHKNYFQWGIVLVVMGMLLQIAESDYCLRIYGKGIGIKTSSFIFSAGIILCALSVKAQELFGSSAVTRSIAWIGEMSFGVYLIHTYSIAVFSKSLHLDNWLVLWMLSLCLTLFVIYLMKKVFPAMILKKYFGF